MYSHFACLHRCSHTCLLACFLLPCFTAFLVVSVLSICLPTFLHVPYFLSCILPYLPPRYFVYLHLSLLIPYNVAKIFLALDPGMRLACLLMLMLSLLRVFLQFASLFSYFLSSVHACILFDCTLVSLPASTLETCLVYLLDFVHVFFSFFPCSFLHSYYLASFPFFSCSPAALVESDLTICLLVSWLFWYTCFWQFVFLLSYLYTSLQFDCLFSGFYTS